MAYNRTLWLPDVLRAAGLTVVTLDGWESRGGSPLTGGFEPDAVVWHHDASPPGDSPGVPAYMLGRFDAAAAQCWVNRAGVWYVLAAGRAPHAGRVLPGMPGNSRSIGVETDHTTGEPWPPVQLDSLRLGTIAILAVLHRAPQDGLHFHKSICSPVGRKVDPDGLDLTAERLALAMLGNGQPVPPPVPVPAPKPKPVWVPEPKPILELGSRGSSVAALQREMNRVFPAYSRLKVDGDFGPKTLAVVREFQRRAGLLVDGVVGPKTRAALNKFGVKF